MLKNYFKIAIRNLLRSKGFSFINIAGLGVGMALALLISIWILDEVNYDRFHENHEQIYQLMLTDKINGEINTWRSVPLPLAENLRTSFPEVKHIVETDWGSNHGLKVGEQRLYKSGYHAHPNFLDIFSFPLLVGDSKTVLNEPNSIVINESTAEALFGHQNYTAMLGEQIRMDNQHDMTVTGVMQNVPKNSSLRLHFLVPFRLWESNEDWVAEARENWESISFQMFLEFQPGADIAAFTEKANTLLTQHSQSPTSTISLHACDDWRLLSTFENGKAADGFIKYVRMFGMIGLFVLLIACINFMNLSTARSTRRAKEVGIRKTLGSNRGQLINQFLGEALLISLMAFALSIVIAEMALPFFNELTNKSLSIPIGNLYFWIIGLGVTICAGLLAGSYPAFFLSAFQPIALMKSHSDSAPKGKLPRKVLVVAQFSISTALIIATLVIYQQLQHVKSRDIGYNPDRLVSVNLSNDLIDHFEPLKNELLSSDWVSDVTKASSPITSIYSYTKDIYWPGKDQNAITLFASVATSEDYFETVGIRLKEGRFFSKEYPSDLNAVILNQSALDKMNLEEPFETHITWYDTTFQIVGIVEDAVMVNPFSKPDATIYSYNPNWNGEMIFRLKENVDTREALLGLAPIFNKHNPTYPFEYNFVSEEFKRKFTSEELVGQLAGIFGILAIFISCLGLFGLAAFMSERRSKEISIRKILGASIFNIWTLMSQDFVRLVVLATFIAIPFTVYFLNDWLAGFDYHITLSWWIFGAAGLLAIFATLLTVSFQSIKVALVNPAETLRSE